MKELIMPLFIAGKLYQLHATKKLAWHSWEFTRNTPGINAIKTPPVGSELLKD